MERVQIASDAGNGQFYDTKGRLLYTMGDVNVFPGMWVWTNGKTIYGHQPAGEQPINSINNPVLPIPNYQGMDELDTQSGELKSFVSKYGIVAYVGDKAHAYIQLYNNEWVNVITGEHMGKFSPADACIGNDGSLLTIESGSVSYHYGGNKGKESAGVPSLIANSIENFVSHTTRDVGGGFLNEIRESIPYDLQVEWTEFNKSFTRSAVSTDGQDLKSEPIKIRRNGKVIKEINLVSYIEDIKSLMYGRLTDVHNKNPGSDKDKKVYGIQNSQGDINDINYSASFHPWPHNKYSHFFYGDFIDVELTRPNIDYWISLYTNILKINKDSSFFAVINIAANGYAYPFFKSYKSGYDDTPVLPHYIHFWDWPDGANKEYIEHTKYIDDMPGFRFKNEPDDDWITVNVNYYKVLSLPDNKTLTENESVNISGGVFLGPMTPMTEETVKTVKFLPGYDLELAEVKSLSGNTNQFIPKAYYATHVERYKNVSKTDIALDYTQKSINAGAYTLYIAGRPNIIKTESLGYRYLYHLTPATKLNNYINNKLNELEVKSGQQIIDLNNCQYITLNLDNRFSVKVEFADNNINAPLAVYVYDGKKQIAKISDTRNYGFIIYNWWLVKVGALTPGRYIITVPVTGYPYIISDNQVTEIKKEFIYKCYTLEYFKNRNTLKRKIAALLSSGAG